MRFPDRGRALILGAAALCALCALAWAGLGIHGAIQSLIINVVSPRLSPGTGYNGTSGGMAQVEAYAPATTQTITGTSSGSGGAVAITLNSGKGSAFASYSVCYVKGIAGTKEGNGLWPCSQSGDVLTLTGSTYVNAMVAPPSPNPSPIVSAVVGGQVISGISCNAANTALTCPNGPISVQVPSTANMATSDIFTVGGTNPGTPTSGFDGGYQIIKLDSTHVQLCGTVSGSTGSLVCNNPPEYSSVTMTGPGAIGYIEPPIADFDFNNGTIVEDPNGVTGAVVATTGNRGWINYVQCYMEPSGSTGVVTINNTSLNTYWASSPKIANGATIMNAYGTGMTQPTSLRSDWGFVFTFGANSLGDGDATLACDIVPTNGITRRIHQAVWLNQPAYSGYVNRTTSPVYVSATHGVDPVSTSSGTITFSGPAPTPGHPQYVHFSTTQTFASTNYLITCQSTCASGESATSETLGVQAANSNGLDFYIYGVGTIPNIGNGGPTSVSYSRNLACETGFGAATKPFKTLEAAAPCAAAAGANMIFVDNTAPTQELPLGGGTGQQYVTRLIQVLPCPWPFTSCATNIGNQSAPWTFASAYRPIVGTDVKIQVSGLLFTDVIWDTSTLPLLNIATMAQTPTWADGTAYVGAQMGNFTLNDSITSDTMDIGSTIFPTNAPVINGRGYALSANGDKQDYIFTGTSSSAGVVPDSRLDLYDGVLNSFTLGGDCSKRNVAGANYNYAFLIPGLYNCAIIQTAALAPTFPNGDAQNITTRGTIEPIIPPSTAAPCGSSLCSTPLPNQWMASENAVPIEQYPAACGGPISAGKPCLTGVGWDTIITTAGSLTVTIPDAGVYTVLSDPGGSGYVAGAYNSVPITGGSGTGLTGTFTVNSSGVVTAVTITGGTGYLYGDGPLTVSNTYLGNSGSGWVGNIVGVPVTAGQEILSQSIPAGCTVPSGYSGALTFTMTSSASTCTAGNVTNSAGTGTTSASIAPVTYAIANTGISGPIFVPRDVITFTPQSGTTGTTLVLTSAPSAALSVGASLLTSAGVAVVSSSSVQVTIASCPSGNCSAAGTYTLNVAPSPALTIGTGYRANIYGPYGGVVVVPFNTNQWSTQFFLNAIADRTTGKGYFGCSTGGGTPGPTTCPTSGAITGYDSTGSSQTWTGLFSAFQSTGCEWTTDYLIITGNPCEANSIYPVPSVTQIPGPFTMFVVFNYVSGTQGFSCSAFPCPSPVALNDSVLPAAPNHSDGFFLTDNAIANGVANPAQNLIFSQTAISGDRIHFFYGVTDYGPVSGNTISSVGNQVTFANPVTGLVVGNTISWCSSGPCTTNPITSIGRPITAVTDSQHVTIAAPFATFSGNYMVNQNVSATANWTRTTTLTDFACVACVIYDPIPGGQASYINSPTENNVWQGSTIWNVDYTPFLGNNPNGGAAWQWNDTFTDNVYWSIFPSDPGYYATLNATGGPAAFDHNSYCETPSGAQPCGYDSQSGQNPGSNTSIMNYSALTFNTTAFDFSGITLPTMSGIQGSANPNMPNGTPFYRFDYNNVAVGAGTGIANPGNGAAQ